MEFFGPSDEAGPLNEMNRSSIHLFLGPVSGNALQFFLEPVSGRWQEKISLSGIETDEAIVIESVVDDESRWPLSPPWQEAVSEKHGDQNVLMAIGRAGRSHWSGCWRIVPESGGEAIEAEIACRIHDPPDFLGSTFRVAGRQEVVSENGDRIAIVGEDATITFYTDPLLAHVQKTSDSLFSIQPVLALPSPVPDTVSYRYRIIVHRNS